MAKIAPDAELDIDAKFPPAPPPPLVVSPRPPGCVNHANGLSFAQDAPRQRKPSLPSASFLELPRAGSDGSLRVPSRHSTLNGRRQPLFQDMEAIKKKVRETLCKPIPYSVANYYHPTGLWRYLATHSLFENVTLAVISFNAVYIAVDTDYNDADTMLESHPAFQFFEHAFCFYFSLEWLIRFMAFRRKADGLKDGWFVFDSSLVVMMVCETWVLTAMQVLSDGGPSSPFGDTAIFRLFRLLRLSRLVRMLKSMPELMILIKGMVTAMKSVCYVMVLLILVTYVFAVAFTQLARGTEMGEIYFDHVALAMYSLLVYGTFLDNLADFCNDLRAESPVCMAIVVVFVCLSALTVMNMLIGVLCEVISAVADTEREELRTAEVVDKMRHVTHSIDTNLNGMISYKEFTQILETPEATRALQEVDVDPVGMVDFAELFFMEDGEPVELPFDKFMELVLDLRGTNTATLKDVMHLGKQLKDTKDSLQVQIEALQGGQERIERQLQRVVKALNVTNGQSQSSRSPPRPKERTANNLVYHTDGDDAFF